MKTPPGEAVKAFVGLLEHPDVHTRIDATYWLLKLTLNRNPASAVGAAVSALTIALRAVDGSVQSGAALTLGEMGLPAMNAVPELIRLLKEKAEPKETPPKINLWRKEKTPRSKAAIALGRILTKPDLDEASKPDQSPQGKQDDHLLEAVDILKDPNEPEFLRQRIGWALGTIGPEVGYHFDAIIQIAQPLPKITCNRFDTSCGEDLCPEMMHFPNILCFQMLE